MNLLGSRPAQPQPAPRPAGVPPPPPPRPNNPPVRPAGPAPRLVWPYVSLGLGAPLFLLAAAALAWLTGAGA